MLMNKYVARKLDELGLGKYVHKVKLYKEGDDVDSPYLLTVKNKENESIIVGFDVTSEFKDQLELALKLL